MIIRHLCACRMLVGFDIDTALLHYDVKSVRKVTSPSDLGSQGRSFNCEAVAHEAQPHGKTYPLCSDAPVHGHRAPQILVPGTNSAPIAQLGSAIQRLRAARHHRQAQLAEYHTRHMFHVHIFCLFIAVDHEANGLARVGVSVNGGAIA